jgi:large subunit ribosomal protein L25
MNTDFTLNAQAREASGKNANRRLRREGLVPGIIYGGHGDNLTISIPHNELERNLEHEAFYSRVITVKIGKKKEEAILKALQRHPAKAKLLHLDLQRVVAGEAISVHVPLHFVGEEESPGIRQSDGVIEHHRNEIEITCLPRNLPEYIEVDVSGLDVDESIHLSEVTFPEGVESVDLTHEHDITLISMHHPRVEEEPVEEAEAVEAVDEEDQAEAEDQAETDEESQEKE